MRWIPALIIILTMGACSSQKPAARTDSGVRTNQRINHPAQVGRPPVAKTVATNVQPVYTTNNTVISNGFSKQPDPGFEPIQFKYAIIMDVPVEALSNLKLFAFIDDWFGTPYHFGGNSKAGIDCSAFANNLVNAVFGVNLPRMARDQYKACSHVKKSKLLEGDLVFFHTTRKGISHVGIYLGNNKFVHASLNYGVTISDLSDGYYARTFRAGGRVRQDTGAAASAN